MSLTIDNKGAVDYTNGWSAGGRMKHACIRLGFLREMKEQGLLDVNWCSSEEMHADVLTKNLGGALFKRHVAVFCGGDDYG
jgi:hypothetical protein